MRKFALMVYLDRPYGESLRRVAREVWTLDTKVYKSAEALRRSLQRIAAKYGNNR